MKKIITIIGARPQFVKASVLSIEMAASHGLEEVIVHTGQHFDDKMSDIFFDELKIPKPKYSLNIGGGTHGENTGAMIIEIEKVLIKESPDAVLVYGDTDSTLAGAISASKLHIPIMHVEAGLRSFNRLMPEEINRVLTDHISNLLFTPSSLSKRQLINEGINEMKIKVVGDIMCDATKKFTSHSMILVSSQIKAMVANNEEFVLITLHRAENVDNKDRLEALLKCLSLLNTKGIFPMHPRTSRQMKKFNLQLPENIEEIEPIGYFDMLFLESKASCIITDSGGVQKEAYFNKTPCITLRTETEWVELVELGVNFIVGSDIDKFQAAQNKIKKIQKAKFTNEIYGRGNTASLIIEEIQNYFRSL